MMQLYINAQKVTILQTNVAIFTKKNERAANVYVDFESAKHEQSTLGSFVGRLIILIPPKNPITCSGKLSDSNLIILINIYIRRN